MSSWTAVRPLFGHPAEGQRMGKVGTTRLKVRFESDAVIVRGEDQNIDDRLLVRGTYCVEIDLRRDVSDQINEADIGGCGHAANQEGGFIAKKIQKTRSCPGDGPEPAGFACPSCPSDMAVAVDYVPQAVFARLRIDSYRDLGPRGHHRSEIWKLQKSRYMAIYNNEFDRTNGYRFGNKRLSVRFGRTEKAASGKAQ